jgi:prepilin-type N-terminal cleavage/methylation domain-containing protein
MLRRLLRSPDHGFTLIELLVVILIIGILIALAAPSFLGQTAKAHDSTAEQSLAVGYRAAKAEAVFNTPQGSWVDAVSLCGPVSALSNDEPEIHFQTSFPGSVSDVSGRRIIECAVSGSNLTLKDLSVPGRVCTLIAPEEGVITGPACGQTPVVPVNLAPSATANNFEDPVWLDNSTVYMDGANGPNAAIFSVATASPDATSLEAFQTGADLTTPKIRGGNLFFKSDVSSDFAVYSMPLGGDPATDATQLTPTGTDWYDVSNDGNKILYDISGGMHVKTLAPAGTVDLSLDSGSSESISSDGSAVTYVNAANGDLMTVAVAPFVPASEVDLGSAAVYGVASVNGPTFSPSGSEIAFGALQGGSEAFIIIVNASTGAPIQSIDLGQQALSPPSHLQYSPDGNKIVFDMPNNPATGNFVWVITP